MTLQLYIFFLFFLKCKWCMKCMLHGMRDDTRLLRCTTMQTNCAHQCTKGLAPSKDVRSPRPYKILDMSHSKYIIPVRAVWLHQLKINRTYNIVPAKKTNLTGTMWLTTCTLMCLEMRDNAKQVGSITMLWRCRHVSGARGLRRQRNWT